MGLEIGRRLVEALEVADLVVFDHHSLCSEYPQDFDVVGKVEFGIVADIDILD